MDTAHEGRPQGRHSPTISTSIRKRKFFQESSFIITILLILQLQGKMKLHISLLLVILAVGDSIKYNLELQRNILKFGYGINYKYEGMLTHTFNRFYIVTKFILPSVKDIKFSNLNFDESCAYMNKKYALHTDSSKYPKGDHNADTHQLYQKKKIFQNSCFSLQVY